MGADIADTAAGSGAAGVVAPFRLFGDDFLRQPFLRVFHLHYAERPERAFFDHGARLPDHGVAGVIMGQAEDEAGFGLQRHQRFGLFAAHGHRLVADDVEAEFQRQLCDGKVQVVRGDDRDGVDLIRPRGLAFEHLRVALVNPLSCEAERLAGGDGPRRVGGEGGGDELEFIIEPCRHAVHGPDKSPMPAADHAEAKFCFGFLH